VETFASVKNVENQGESGSQLRLEETGTRISATLRDFFGSGKVMATRLNGTLSQTEAGACKVHLIGRNKDGQVKIDGEIFNTYFQGTATRYLGQRTFSHVMSLKRQLPTDAPAMGPTRS